MYKINILLKFLYNLITLNGTQFLDPLNIKLSKWIAA